MKKPSLLKKFEEDTARKLQWFVEAQLPVALLQGTIKHVVSICFLARKSFF